MCLYILDEGFVTNFIAIILFSIILPIFDILFTNNKRNVYILIQTYTYIVYYPYCSSIHGVHVIFFFAVRVLQIIFFAPLFVHVDSLLLVLELEGHSGQNDLAFGVGGSKTVIESTDSRERNK